MSDIDYFLEDAKEYLGKHNNQKKNLLIAKAIKIIEYQQNRIKILARDPAKILYDYKLQKISEIMELKTTSPELRDEMAKYGWVIE